MSKEWCNNGVIGDVVDIAFWVERVLGGSGLLRTIESVNGDGTRTSRD
jgi:hypothetical protein